eukprot:353182-Chlamydomonas_euryale.AAC.65
MAGFPRERWAVLGQHATTVVMLAHGRGAGPGIQFHTEDDVWAKACANELPLKSIVDRSFSKVWNKEVWQHQTRQRCLSVIAPLGRVNIQSVVFGPHMKMSRCMLMTCISSVSPSAPHASLPSCSWTVSRPATHYFVLPHGGIVEHACRHVYHWLAFRADVSAVGYASAGRM